jgi:hypothetical protein
MPILPDRPHYNHITRFFNNSETEYTDDYGYFIDTETMQFIDIIQPPDVIIKSPDKLYHINTYAYLTVVAVSFSATVLLFEYLHR